MVPQQLILFLFVIISNVFLIKTNIFIAEAPSSCYNPNGRTGVCVSIYNCQSLLSIASNNQKSSFEFLRKSVCRSNGQVNYPYVCCTADTGFDSHNDRFAFPVDYDDEKVDRPTTNRTTEENKKTPSHCSNPNGHTGECVPIYECESLMNIVKANQTSEFEFVRKSKCRSNDRGRQPYVCCTADIGFQSLVDPITAASTTEEFNETEVPSLFPKPPHCGPVHISSRIVGGSEAEIGEFPWLALLEYKSHDGDLVSACSGTIINQRYILTAAHCAKGAIETAVGKLVSVRVGLHNKITQVECKSSGCSDGYHRLGVENVIVHKDYNISDGYRNHHDIALIRMNQNMKFNNLVAPICLPNVIPQIPQLSRGMNLTVAGWGVMANSTYSDVKLKVELPYVESDVCFFNVAPDQFCAGGEIGKDSCRGDSGGSLIRLVGDTWIAEGVASFGIGCGAAIEGVYTRISSYIPWIYANVQP